MKWTKEAQEALSRVPFFVRRRVRSKVEAEAAASGAAMVTPEHLDTCRRRFLKNMEDEVKGYQVETCFGPSGCPKRAVTDDALAGELETLLSTGNLRAFLKSKVQGPLKIHHEFRVTIADCPNACSRPQIADLGLIGAVRPRVSSEPCSECGACLETCEEGAITIRDGEDPPEIDFTMCVSCGGCIKVCPTGTLEKEVEGYRILIGGKLGRHPQLARELGGIAPKKDALVCVEACLAHYKEHNRNGERFGEIINRTGDEFPAVLKQEFP